MKKRTLLTALTTLTASIFALTLCPDALAKTTQDHRTTVHQKKHTMPEPTNGGNGSFEEPSSNGGNGSFEEPSSNGGHGSFEEPSSNGGHGSFEEPSGGGSFLG